MITHTINADQLFELIQSALREINNCPQDSMVDIFNELLKDSDIPLRMNYLYLLEPMVKVEIE